MKVCTKCDQAKPLDSFILRNPRTGRRSNVCRPCVADQNRLSRETQVPVPDHLRDRVRKLGAQVCIPGQVVRDVLRLIDPELTPQDVATAIDCDHSGARRMFSTEWVGEAKLDKLLTAYHCTHLWWGHPALNECRLALLEYEELLVGRELVAA